MKTFTYTQSSGGTHIFTYKGNTIAEADTAFQDRGHGNPISPYVSLSIYDPEEYSD